MTADDKGVAVDPERALAELEQAAARLAEYPSWPSAVIFSEGMRTAAGWLLPLARAGLSVPDLTHRVEGLASTLDGNNRMLRERREKYDALEREVLELARVADTLSPQEVINNVARMLGREPWEYSGTMAPHRSLFDLFYEIQRLKLEQGPR